MCLSPCSRGIWVWHKREMTFTSIREKQMVSVPKLVQLEDSPFLSLSCSLATWGWMETAPYSSSLLLCLWLYLSLPAFLHQEHRAQQGIEHGEHSPPWINQSFTWKGSSPDENGKNKSLSTRGSGLRRRSNYVFPLCVAMWMVLNLNLNFWHYQRAFCNKPFLRSVAFTHTHKKKLNIGLFSMLLSLPNKVVWQAVWQ